MFLSIMIHTYKFKTLTVTCLYYLLLCRDNIVDIDVHLTEFYEKELYEKIVEYLDKPLEDPIEESTEQTFTTKKKVSFFFPDLLLELAEALCGSLMLKKKNIHVRLDCKISDKNKSLKEVTNELAEDVFEKNASKFTSACYFHPRKIITRFVKIEKEYTRCMEIFHAD